MVRYEVEGPKCKEKALTVSVSIEPDGSALITARKREREPWNVAMLTTEGRLWRIGELPENLGLQLDEQGRIELDEGD